jgi:hypothetical protein
MNISFFISCYGSASIFGGLIYYNASFIGHKIHCFQHFFQSGFLSDHINGFLFDLLKVSPYLFAEQESKALQLFSFSFFKRIR